MISFEKRGAKVRFYFELFKKFKELLIPLGCVDASCFLLLSSDFLDNIIVEVFLVADGRALAMARVDCRVVGQREQARTDRLAKLLIVASREVGAPNAPTEQGVTREHPAFHDGIEADAPLGMAGREDDLQGAVTQRNHLIVFQIDIRILLSVLPGHPEVWCLTFGTDIVLLRLSVSGHLDAVTLLHRGIADDMIEMPMRVDDQDGMQLMAVDEAKKPILLLGSRTARVDDDAIAVLIVKDIGVLTDGIENKSVQFEHSGS